MSTRENILTALRRNTREQYDMPNLEALQPTVYDDPVAEFCRKTTTTAGARLLEVSDGTTIGDALRAAFPEATTVATNIEGVSAQLNPDTVADVRELMAADVGVVRGCIGVAENACIWIPQTMREKAVCFASEQLAIVLDRKDIVSNMHEAYARIEASSEFFRDYKFGTFISGPSKTADIESALVYGAQAARAVTVLLFNTEDSEDTES